MYILKLLKVIYYYHFFSLFHIYFLQRLVYWTRPRNIISFLQCEKIVVGGSHCHGNALSLFAFFFVTYKIIVLSVSFFAWFWTIENHIKKAAYKFITTDCPVSIVIISVYVNYGKTNFSLLMPFLKKLF